MIKCMNEKCIHNEGGECLGGNITILSDGHCLDSDDELEEIE